MAQISQLNIYPVKACRGISVPSVRVLWHGFEYDRQWMIVDQHGEFLTQREYPQLARITTRLDNSALALSVYGAGAIEVPLAPYRSSHERRKVSCWRYEAPAFDCGLQASQWLSDFLQVQAHLVRFDPLQTRLCNPEWAQRGAPTPPAHTLFSDGYPILVLGQASVDDLGQRMGVSLETNRFRANLMLSDLPAYEEDHLAELSLTQSTRLKLVKLCPRCPVPSVDQQTGEVSVTEPVVALAQYRFDAQVGGAVLGNNAVVAQTGPLAIGQKLETVYNF
jgi:uncharacterized protein